MGNKVIQINCHECEARSNSIFCALNKDEIDSISRLKSVIAFKKKSIIFHQNDHPLGIYTVNSGKVKIYQTTENGKEQIVRMAKKGDVLGYRALITAENYSCTAEVIEDSNICFIPKTAFTEMMNSNGTVSSNLLWLLSQDLKRAENTISNLVDKPVKARIAEALLFLKQTYGLENDNATLNIVLTREEIGNMVGTSKETAIRLLSELKEENIIQFEGKKIKILNIKLLANLACVTDW